MSDLITTKETMSPEELEKRFVAALVTDWLEEMADGRCFDELPYAARCELVVILEGLAKRFPVYPRPPSFYESPEMAAGDGSISFSWQGS